MIKVYEVRSKKWYESINLASQVTGVSVQRIKSNLDKGEIIENHKRWDFRTYCYHPFYDFRDKMRLQHLEGGFFMSPEGRVYLWSKKQESWFPWKATSFADGTQVIKSNSRWLNLNRAYVRIFGGTND